VLKRSPAAIQLHRPAAHQLQGRGLPRHALADGEDGDGRWLGLGVELQEPRHRLPDLWL